MPNPPAQRAPPHPRISRRRETPRSGVHPRRRFRPRPHRRAAQHRAHGVPICVRWQARHRREHPVPPRRFGLPPHAGAGKREFGAEGPAECTGMDPEVRAGLWRRSQQSNRLRRERREHVHLRAPTRPRSARRCTLPQGDTNERTTRTGLGARTPQARGGAIRSLPGKTRDRGERRRGPEESARGGHRRASGRERGAGRRGGPVDVRTRQRLLRSRCGEHNLGPRPLTDRPARLVQRHRPRLHELRGTPPFTPYTSPYIC